MVANYSIADLVSTLKNGCLANRNKVETSYSQMKEEILKLLVKEGYITSYTKEPVEGHAYEVLVIELKYFDKHSVIRDIKIISKPGKRIYRGVDDIPVVFNGLGMVILSTPKGVIFDKEAREFGVGGELLLQIF